MKQDTVILNTALPLKLQVSREERAFTDDEVTQSLVPIYVRPLEGIMNPLGELGVESLSSCDVSHTAAVINRGAS